MPLSWYETAASRIAKLLVVIGSLVSTQVTSAELLGRAKAIDGDTIVLERHTLNLVGIDAPEADQPCHDLKGQRWACGMEAKRRLEAVINTKTVACRTTGQGVTTKLAWCAVDGQDIGKSLVAAGWALAENSGSASYTEQENSARSAKLGLWRGKFINPRDWRNRTRNPALLGSARATFDARRLLAMSAFGPAGPAAVCAVKGNIISDGSCIYHQPGGRWYAKIRMDPSNGDHWLCSAEDAVAAGCRKTKR